MVCKADGKEGMVPIEARWAGELKVDPSAGFIRSHEIAHWPMPSRCPYAQRSIQAHGWPISLGPQAIVLARQRVNEHSDFVDGSRNFALMRVVNHLARVPMMVLPEGRCQSSVFPAG